MGQRHDRSPVGDAVDLLDAKGYAGRLRHVCQQTHVYDLIGHGLLDDQLMLRIERELNVVADTRRSRATTPAARLKLRLPSNPSIG